MTRNEAKNLIIRNNAEWVWYETIDKIFDEFGEKLQDKDDEIELLKCRIEEAMKPKTCEWYKEDEEDWRGQCGCIWGFNGENPIKAEAYFCPQCGGKIIEIESKGDA